MAALPDCTVNGNTLLTGQAVKPLKTPLSPPLQLQDMTSQLLLYFDASSDLKL